MDPFSDEVTEWVRNMEEKQSSQPKTTKIKPKNPLMSLMQQYRPEKELKSTIYSH